MHGDCEVLIIIFPYAGKSPRYAFRLESGGKWKWKNLLFRNVPYKIFFEFVINTVFCIGICIFYVLI